MIPFLVTSLLLLTFALAFVVVLRPTLQPDKPGIVALISLIAAMPLGGRTLWEAPHLLHLPLVLAALALVPGVTISRSFRSVDVIAVLFHRDFGMQGASLSTLKNELATAGICAFLLVVSSSGLSQFWQAPTTVLTLAIVLLLLANPFVRFGFGRLFRPTVSSVLSDRLVAPRLVPGGDTPDLLIVYLEGVDRRFADRAVFGDIFQSLARYSSEGLTFTNVSQIAGTGWSLAGMVATQSGVPITPRGLHFQSGTQDVSRFMPGITYLGDVLAAKGYQSHYVVGGDVGFGGISAMYATHQFTRMVGLEEQRSMYSAEEFAAASVRWFIDDQMTFDTARKTHGDLLAGNRPFALVVETIGPHGPKGYLSRRFSGTGQAMETRDMLRTVECLIIQVAEFLSDIRSIQAASGRELRIVILSDHLNHNHAARLPPGSESYAERNTVILFGDPARKGQEVTKPGSMVDVFPTLLDWLGWAENPVAAGIGRSLLADPPSLVEEFGVAAVDGMIHSDAAFSNRIWDETACLAEKC